MPVIRAARIAPVPEAQLEDSGSGLVHVTGSELAARYGASVAEETDDWRVVLRRRRAVPAGAAAVLGSPALGLECIGRA
jgi:hypothetical protein